MKECKRLATDYLARVPALLKQMNALRKLHNQTSGDDREQVKLAMDELERQTAENQANLDAILAKLDELKPPSLDDEV